MVAALLQKGRNYVQGNAKSAGNRSGIPVRTRFEKTQRGRRTRPQLSLPLNRRHQSHATPRTVSTLFSVDPQASTETLAVYLVETLASIDVMVHQLVDHLDGGSRNALLGISNSVMLAEITANRVLDQIDPPE
jgi:hypothetical protein